MTKEPALTRDEAVQAIEVGIDLVQQAAAEGVDIIGTGRYGHRQHHTQQRDHRGILRRFLLKA